MQLDTVQLKGNVASARKLRSSNGSSARICYFSKRTTQESITHCYTIVHDTVGILSTFQESVLLYLLNTQSYENCHSSLMVKENFNL